MEDKKIVELYWQRNEEAIPETAAKYGSYCRIIAYNILADDEDAEECVNDTCQRGRQPGGTANRDPIYADRGRHQRAWMLCSP